MMFDFEKINSKWQSVFNDIPMCPSCDDNMQMQIMDMWTFPMKWRCRICFSPVEYEPRSPSDPKTFWERITGWLH